MNLGTLSIIVMVLVSIITVILIILSKFSRKRIEHKESNYIQREVLFTAAERSFYGVLDQSVSKDYKIFGKVRVADVLKPNSNMNRSDWQVAFNKISAKHFDYVLCEKDTLKVFGVIELDDKSHDSKRAKERDHFLEKACESASLKLIRFKAQQSYQIDSVRTKIKDMLGITPTIDTIDKAELKVTVNIDGSSRAFSDVDIESKYGRNVEKISTSKLAKKLGMKTPLFLEKMVSSGYLISSNEVHRLTEKGKSIGGEYKEKGRYPAHFLWSKDFTEIELN
jgi:hypothetical protein